MKRRYIKKAVKKYTLKAGGKSHARIVARDEKAIGASFERIVELAAMLSEMADAMAKALIEYATAMGEMINNVCENCFIATTTDYKQLERHLALIGYSEPDAQ